MNNLKKLGKVLGKQEQKSISGGLRLYPIACNGPRGSGGSGKICTNNPSKCPIGEGCFLDSGSPQSQAHCHCL